jgi:recombination protein RecA
VTVLPLPATHLLEVPRPQPALWSLAAAAGRLVEIAGAEDSAVLTLTTSLVFDAQQAGEQAAWILPAEASFFAPDVLESGVDLDALAVVRVPTAAAAARAADKLLRSGSFGIVVLDIGSDPRVPTPLLARLASLAQRNHSALIFLTQPGLMQRGARHDRSPHGTVRPGDAPASSDAASAGTSPLGSLISLRVRARRQRIAADQFRCWLEVLKDKRRGPTWGHEEVCRGAPGMR